MMEQRWNGLDDSDSVFLSTFVAGVERLAEEIRLQIAMNETEC
jgi:hypothetical protein